jgi:hypothetical protein
VIGLIHHDPGALNQLVEVTRNLETKGKTPKFGIIAHEMHSNIREVGFRGKGGKFQRFVYFARRAGYISEVHHPIHKILHTVSQNIFSTFIILTFYKDNLSSKA